MKRRSAAEMHHIKTVNVGRQIERLVYLVLEGLHGSRHLSCSLPLNSWNQQPVMLLSWDHSEKFHVAVLKPNLCICVDTR